jgi:arginyl-tRNA synthetase
MISIDEKLHPALCDSVGSINIVLQQPKISSLGDFCFFLKPTQKESIESFKNIYFIEKYSISEKNHVNIFLKNEFLNQNLRDLVRHLTPISKETISNIYPDFCLQYCYARCISVIRYGSECGYTPHTTEFKTISFEMRAVLIHLLRFSDKTKSIHDYLKKLCSLFEKAWQNAPNHTRLRFIDERDMTKSNLHLTILLAITRLVDHALARINLKVLDEINL